MSLKKVEKALDAFQIASEVGHEMGYGEEYCDARQNLIHIYKLLIKSNRAKQRHMIKQREQIDRLIMDRTILENERTRGV